MDREEIVGVVRGYVPYIGWSTLTLKEAPVILYTVIAALIGIGLLGSFLGRGTVSS